MFAVDRRIGLGVLVILVVATPIAAVWVMNQTPTEQPIVMKITLLYNAGVMIEVGEARLYIDPVSLPGNYSDKPADVILITHPHSDHYSGAAVSMLEKDSTVIVFPENMSSAMGSLGGTGVNPGDNIVAGIFNITAFYMYTTAPEGYDPSHPPEANWTSYIIEFYGFTVFHAGDSKCIEEYEELTGKIDLALLPLGPGCQTMADAEVVDAIEVIGPTYFIPIHYTEGADATFIATYGDDVEAAGCEVVSLAYFHSREIQVAALVVS